MSEASRLLHRVIKGSQVTVRRHIERSERMQVLIAERFGVRRITKWRAKHVRWCLEHGLVNVSSATRYDYYKTVKVMATRLGRWENWQKYLKGPWTRP